MKTKKIERRPNCDKPPAKRSLIGRTIIDVEYHPFDDGVGGTAYMPIIYLDNNKQIIFCTQETDVGEYGTLPIMATQSPSRVQSFLESARKQFGDSKNDNKFRRNELQQLVSDDLG
jgi:hypothetical protein